MERSYPKRYNAPGVEGIRALISSSLGPEVSVEGEIDADRAEIILADDTSLFSRGSTGTRGTRVDVLYVDKESEAVRLVGPVNAERYDEIPDLSADTAPPTPLPLLLWRAGTEPGVWIVISSRKPEPQTESYTRRLIRVTEAVLERGRRLESDLAWCREMPA